MRSGLKSAAGPLTNELHETMSSASEEIPLPPQPHSIYKRTDSCDQSKASPSPAVRRSSASIVHLFIEHSQAKQHISRQTTQKQRLAVHSCMCKSPDAPRLSVCSRYRVSSQDKTISSSLHLPAALLRPLLDGIDANMSLCSKFSNPKSTKI